MVTINKSIYLAFLGTAALFSNWTQADPEFPADVVVKSMEIIEFNPAQDLGGYPSISYFYYAEVALLTLDEPIECDNTYNSNNLSFLTDKVVVLPPFAANAPGGESTRHLLGPVTLINGAMLTHQPVKMLHLEASAGDTKPTTSIAEFCVAKPADIIAAAPPLGTVGGIVVTEGGSIPDPIQTSWGFNIPSAGDYQIYAHWVAQKNIVASATYDFNSSGSPTSITVNPDFTAGIWVKLGDVRSFSAGQQTVDLVLDQNGLYVVDGIKVEKVN